MCNIKIFTMAIKYYIENKVSCVIKKREGISLYKEDRKSIFMSI